MKRLITLMIGFTAFTGFSQTNALKFDGSTTSSSADHVATPYVGIPDSSARTVEMWIKRGSILSTQGIFCEWGVAVTSATPRFTFKVQNNHLRVETGGAANALEGTTYLGSTSTWYHVAVVVDPTLTTDRVKIYLNGNLETSGYIAVNTDTTSAAPLHIGTRWNGVGGFNGAIDEFRVWNVARTQAEIQANMNTELCTLPPSLVSYFRFNEGIAAGNNTSITTVLDEVNPGAVNTLLNFTMTGTSSNFVQGTIQSAEDMTIIPVTSCTDYTWTENNTTYATSGQYDVVYTNVSGCDSTIRLDLTIPVIDNTVTDNMDGTLTANMVGAGYQWLDCNNAYAPISGSSTQTFVAPATGSYAVQLDVSGCQDTSVCTSVSTIPSFINPGMDFDGVDDYVQTQYSGISGNGARTVEAWVKIPASNTTTQHTILDWGNTSSGTRFTTNILNNKLRLEIAGGGLNGTTLLNDDTWHHVAVSYDPADNDTVRLFVDGVQENAGVLAISVNTGTAVDVLIGTRVDNANLFFGTMDEVRMWNTARTAAEINATMNTAICTANTNLVAYYSFNEGVPFANNTGISTLKDYAALTQTAVPMNMTFDGVNSNFVVGASLPDGMSFIASQENACESYTWITNGQTYNTSGIYSVTNTNLNGCDSITVLNLTINQPVNTVDTQIACGPYTWIDGLTYNASNTTAVHTFPNGAANGCDSIVTLNLTIPVIDNTVTDNMNGTLTANSTTATYQWLDCDNGNAELPGETGQTYTALATGTYSVVVTELGCADTSNCIVVNTVPSFINSAMHFDGTDDYIQTTFPGILGNNSITVESWVKTAGGNNEQVITSWGTTTSGARFTTRLAASGSDFVLRVENNGGGLNGTINLFDGNWHHVAVTYDAAATLNKYKLYVDGVLDVEGDISTPLFVLEDVEMRIGRRIHPTYTGYFNGAMDEVRVWDVVRTQAEISALMNASICQETANLVSYFSFNEGTPQADNTAITALKDYAAYTQDANPMGLALNGISSNFVVGLNLPSGIDFQLMTAENCVDYMWSENNQTYTNSGIYTVPLVGTNGCDSLQVLNLTIHPATELILNETVCGSYTLNGQSYTTSGSYTQSLTNAAGCDSTITLNLIVNQPATGTDVQTACGSYTWIDNVTYTSSNTTATHTIVGGAISGCDSTVTLNLTINQPAAGTDVQTACNAYTWIDGLTYIADNSTATFTISGGAANGCDSVVTLDLTVVSVLAQATDNGDASMTASPTGLSYQWYDCDANMEISGAQAETFTPVSNGNYAVIVTNGNCSDTSACVYIGNVGVQELKGSISAVYPNPFKSDVIIEFASDLTGTLLIKDVHGRTVHTMDLVATKKTVLEMGDQPAGIYFIVLETMDTLETIRVVKD